MKIKKIIPKIFILHLIIALLSVVPCLSFAVNETNNDSESPESVITLEPVITEEGLCVLLGEYNGVYKDPELSFCYRRTDAASFITVKPNKTLSEGRYNVQIEVESGAEYICFFSCRIHGNTECGKIIRFHTPEYTQSGIYHSIFENRAENKEFIFGENRDFTYTVDNTPLGYANAGEADKHIIKIKVPVWKLVKGEKVPSSLSLSINRKLTGNIKAVFLKLYDMKFPIVKLKGYSYRRIGGGCAGSKKRISSNGILSAHSFGTAIDINPTQNDLYYRTDGRDVSDPYYITDEVIKLFKEYGWEWGGDWTEFVDTMHFQYIG